MSSGCSWAIHAYAMTLMRQQFWHAQDGKCGICGNGLSRNFSSPKLTFDHVWPKSWAAMSYRAERVSRGNLLLTHLNCNASKDDQRPNLDQIALLWRVNRAIGLPQNETYFWDQDGKPGGEI